MEADAAFDTVFSGLRAKIAEKIRKNTGTDSADSSPVPEENMGDEQKQMRSTEMKMITMTEN